MPCLGALSHLVTPVPSAQVGGSPPNAAEDPSLDAFSLPCGPGCCLCSALPQQSPLGVPKEGTKENKSHPLWDFGTVHGHGVSPIRNAGYPLPGCGQGGSDMAHRGQAAAGAPAHSGGEGITRFLSVCIFFPRLSLNTR